MSDRVPPSSSCCPVVREVVLNPLVDVFHRKPFVGRIFYSHENQTAKGVWGFGRGSGRRSGRLRELDLGQRVNLEQGLQW